MKIRGALAFVLIGSCFAAEYAAGAADPPAPVNAADFAALAHYAQANSALRPPASANERVVFMGDSITESWATVDPEFFATAGYVDRGVSGQTTPQMLLRFRQDVVDLKPQVVHIMAGTNDVAENTGPLDLSATESNIASMVDIALTNGIQVVLGSIPPAAKFPWRPGIAPGPKIAMLNAWLERYCNTRHLIYADYYAALNDGAQGMKTGLSKDGVHPTLDGYRVMDPIGRKAIDTALRGAKQRHP